VSVPVSRKENVECLGLTKSSQKKSSILYDILGNFLTLSSIFEMMEARGMR
jgi:hypothetical protein